MYREDQQTATPGFNVFNFMYLLYCQYGVYSDINVLININGYQ